MPTSPPVNPHFSPREQELIDKLLEGHSVKKIATALNISANTVKDYLKTVYQKAQVHSARELIVKLRSDQVSSVPATELLHAAELVVDSRHSEETVERLLMATRVCTRASRTALWFATSDGAETVLAPASFSSEAQRLRIASAFLQHVLEQGVAELPANESAALERRRLEPLGVYGAILGYRVQFAERTAVLLVMDAGDAEGFGETEHQVLDFLVRLAELRLRGLPTASTASA